MELFKWAAEKLVAQQGSPSTSSTSRSSYSEADASSSSGDRPFDLKLVAPPFTSMRKAMTEAAPEGSTDGATIESAGCCSARLNLEWL